jgi:hypothetical protein
MLHLPLMNGFQIWREERSGLTMFVTEEKARKFCEETRSVAPRLTAVTIDFWQLETRPVLQERSPCDRPRPQQWWPILCRFQKGKRMDIHRIGIFDPHGFDSKTMLSFELDTADGSGSGTPDDQPWRRHASGLWQRGGDYRGTFWRGYQPPLATSPWIARCVQQNSSLSSETVWRCNAGYQLKDGMAVASAFEAGLDSFAADAARIDGRVSAIAAGLMQRSGPVPSRR